MLKIKEIFLIISLSFCISLLAITKAVNVYEYRTVNSLIDKESSKSIALEIKFIEMNNKLLYKKSFLEANKNSNIELAMIKPEKTYLVLNKKLR